MNLLPPEAPTATPGVESQPLAEVDDVGGNASSGLAPDAAAGEYVAYAEGSIEALICSVGFPDCEKALRVARCESGPDYYAPIDKYHVGTFQIAHAYHAGKFAAHGWDIFIHGEDIYKNSVVALEILASAGYVWTGHWPNCGYR